ncbi:hypothetical protein L6452_22754 [Arctium lappa]|uniref:Uncharacterized protein n=1 Tax=Arctium lappa TaxID=4217 RepID=A0ACB9B109_ARCLA|nr:hypothetical protein L6452_22754 [Arctium lappa]
MKHSDNDVNFDDVFGGHLMRTRYSFGGGIIKSEESTSSSTRLGKKSVFGESRSDEYVLSPRWSSRTTGSGLIQVWDATTGAKQYTFEGMMLLCVLYALATKKTFRGVEGLSPINLLVETDMHRACPGGTGGVKTIGNYATVSMSISASTLILKAKSPFIPSKH